ncbi:hypothetical protein [Chryseobacterium sp. Mn2064]|uniref:hypothetical protein n=1 Tax=Chryseobacterium sp. Mn2064 TaxID=3395263 RepID=UPI003BD09619
MKKNTTFLGLTKKEILLKLGQEFNFYPDKKWSYVLKIFWYGKKKILYLTFDESDKVISQSIESKYGKI